MLLTQPFLLYLVLRGKSLKQPKKTWFEKLGEICIDAARNAVVVLKCMRAEGSLSSLTTFDCTCALKMIMIFSLDIARKEDGDGAEVREAIERTVEVLADMEHVGFVKSVVEELPARLEMLGIKEKEEKRLLMGSSSNDLQPAHGQLWADFDA